MPVGILAAGLLFNLPLVRGQTFQLGGGSSSLFQASGGSVEVHAPNYEGWVGVGSLNGQMRLGAYLSTQWRGTTLGLGDNTIPFRFPTDIFDSSHYLLGRGGSIALKKKRFSLFAFGGATSQGFSSPFFRGAKAESGVGLLFLDVKLTPKLQLFSRNIISNRQTSINGLEWQPRTGVKAALAAGVGANQGYLGSTVAVDRRWLSLKAGYFVAGSRFRRIVIQSPLSSETDRENILVTLHPKPFLDFTVGRFNFLQPASDTSAALRATLNQYSASARAARFTLTASLFDSRVRGTHTEGTSVSLRRDFASRVQTGITFFHSRSGKTPSSTSLVPMIREVISARFSLLQLVNHTNGQTSFALGGEFLSNPISVGVEYQPTYSPFRPGNPFRQALLFHLRLQPSGSFQVNGGSYVAPDGSVKYTAYGSTLLYHGQEKPGAPPSFKFPKYIISGRVLDQDDQPVVGAAVRIDGEVVFSNSEGEFFLRRKKARPCHLKVLLNEFLVPGLFEVMSFPETVTPSMQEQEAPILIVLRRLKSSPQKEAPSAGNQD